MFIEIKFWFSFLLLPLPRHNFSNNCKRIKVDSQVTKFQNAWFAITASVVFTSQKINFHIKIDRCWDGLEQIIYISKNEKVLNNRKHSCNTDIDLLPNFCFEEVRQNNIELEKTLKYFLKAVLKSELTIFLYIHRSIFIRYLNKISFI